MHSELFQQLLEGGSCFPSRRRRRSLSRSRPRLCTMKLTLSLVAFATLSQAATNPQLYFSPSSSSSHSSSASSTPLSLTPHQANAALAHLLSVSHHVQLPLQSGKKGANDWRRVLEEDVDATAPKVVLAIECPASDAACRGE